MQVFAWPGVIFYTPRLIRGIFCPVRGRTQEAVIISLAVTMGCGEDKVAKIWFCTLSLHFYTNQGHIPRDSTSYSGLDPPTSVSNHGNA